MSKKNNDDDDALRAVDDPTASFPIGTLGGLEPRAVRPPSTPLGEEALGAPPFAERPSGAPEDPHVDEADTFVDELDADSQDLDDAHEDWLEHSNDGETSGLWPSIQSGISPAWLVLSLVGGAALALAVLAVIAVVLLLG